MGPADPFSRRMQELLDETFGAFGWPSSQLMQRDGFSPFVDVEETDDAYVIEAELPGVKRDGVTVEHMGNELMIAGEIKERQRKGVVRRATRHTGHFDYRLALPAAVDGAKIDAKLADGILTVRVPKAEKAAHRRIEIKST